MAAPTSSFYQVGASLPVDALSYVKRLADQEFYQKLKAGKFCYVLNSRQMGKSSLRVQTMQRLQASGTVCAAIDLTGIGKHKVTMEQWYGGIAYALVQSCQLEDKFDFDWQTCWQKHQEVFDPVMCLRLLIEKVLLEKISQQIVIFVDEIDRVLSQKFSLDDFFALIRFFQNQRVDNPAFERLTFALLGVATPSDLITDKTQTPFNIGEAIELHGFQIDEVEPLIKGLRSRFRDPQAVMKEILDWTGGQPFLTQKLCQFMVEESEKENPRAVESVVRSRIIENWESLDEPEHLRTIRDRILSREQRAPYLLELYQQIRLEDYRKVIADNTLEQSELQLSGLVVRQQNKLRVYNPIYRDVFDQNWIETQLRNLRPYSENFKFWVASGGSDDSRLLRGKALQDALEWSRDKSLSYQDRQFLAASQAKEREEEIAALEKEAALERERKDREAAEQRNQVLAEANQTLADANDTLTKANKKAKRRIRVGSVVLVLTLLGAVISGSLAVVTLGRIQEQANNLSLLSKLSGELQSKKKQQEADEARRQLGLSYAIKENHKLQQALLLSGIALAYQNLEKPEDAIKAISDSMKLLGQGDIKSSPQEKEVRVHVLNIQGALYNAQKNNTGAIEAYKKAFDLLRLNQLNPRNSKTKVLTSATFESVHRRLIEMLAESSQDNDLLSQVRESLKEHYYAELDNLLENRKWEAADRLTSELMLYIAKGEKEGYLDTEDIKNFSCKDLRKIDENWKNHSDGHFGLGVQKKIWLETGNRQEYNEAYSKFLSRLRWNQWDYDMIILEVEKDYSKAPEGILPTYATLGFVAPRGEYPYFRLAEGEERRVCVGMCGWYRVYVLGVFSRARVCQL